MNANATLCGRYNYENISKWKRKAPGKKKNYFIINIDNNHWACIVVYMEENQIQYYDSLNNFGKGHKYLEGTLRYLTLIVPSESLVHIPPGIRDILQLVESDASAIYVRKLLPAGQDHIDILLHNLWSSSINPTSINFEDIFVSWYSDLLLDYDQATNETGVNNQIFHPTGSFHKKTVPPSLFPLWTHVLLYK
jgi:hypothetical protein